MLRVATSRSVLAEQRVERALADGLVKDLRVFEPQHKHLSVNRMTLDLASVQDAE